MSYTFTDAPKPPSEEPDVLPQPGAGLPTDPKDPFPNDESSDPGIPVKNPSPDTTESPS